MFFGQFGNPFLENFSAYPGKVSSSFFDNQVIIVRGIESFKLRWPGDSEVV